MGPMDPSKRVEELEAQVQALNAQVQELLARHDATEEDPPEEASTELAASPLVGQVRAQVERVIGANSDDSIEAHIGAVWLSRLAMVVTMTFLVLGARFTVGTDALGNVQKVAAGYGVTLLFVLFALWQRKRADAFTQALLGCGLAALYFTTYAAFFVQEMRLLDQPWIGTGILAACLGVLGWSAHRWKSQTVAGIGLFLAYYTILLSGALAPSIETLTYGLVTCATLALVALLLHLVHQWLFLSWGALIATHGTYLYFFWSKPHGLDIPDNDYFWISNGFLTLCYVLFSLIAILDARKRGEYRRFVAPLAGFNSLVYFCATYWSIRDAYPNDEWSFRLAFACVLAAFALLAETTGPRRNYLFQIFIAKAVIMLTLAIQSYLSNETLLVAFAIECIGLAISYRRSGVVVFKVMGLALATLTFALCLLSVKMAGTVEIRGYVVQANWFNAIGVSIAFTFLAFLYERFIGRMQPEQRTLSGQWFLADSWLDITGGLAALFHAAAAAIILLTFTILEGGEDVALPYILAAEASIMAAVGLLLFTPQIEIACVLLLVAAHVCYHVFLWLPQPGFELQENYTTYTLAMAGLTYVGAHAFERYLNRFRFGPRDLDHHLLAAFPYLAGTFLILTLVSRETDVLYLPPVCAALGLALLLLGVLTRYTGVVASSIMAMLACGVHFYIHLYNSSAPLARQPEFLPFLGLMLATFAINERLLFAAERTRRLPQNFSSISRTIYVAATAIFGLLGLHAWSQDRDVLVFYLLGHGLITLALGAIFSESRYRWAGLFLFVAAIGWAFLHFEDLAPLFQLLTFGASAAVLLLVSWGYSQYRRPAPRTEDEPGAPGHD